MDIFQERVNFYCIRSSKASPSGSEFGVFLVSSRDTRYEPDSVWSEKFSAIGVERQRHESMFSAYIAPLANVLCEIDSDAVVPIRFGDSTIPLDFDCFAKVRRIGERTISLLNLNKDRHWGAVNSALGDNISVSSKRSMVLFRGSTTGCWGDEKEVSPIHRESVLGMGRSRHSLLKKWCGVDHPFIDLGFTDFVQQVEARVTVDELACLNSMKQGYMSLSEMLNYRYGLALEGNDVATNLKWLLASQSVPIMPPPTFESWIMESRLQPWIHYIPIQPDTADLVDVVGYCERNLSLVEYISKRGREYILNFMNSDVEKEMHRLVVTKWLHSFC